MTTTESPYEVANNIFNLSDQRQHRSLVRDGSNELPTTQEEAQQLINNIREQYADDIVDYIGNLLMNEVYNSGFKLDTTKQDTMKNSILVLESLRGLLYQHLGIKYFTQDLANQHIDVKFMPDE